MGVIELAIYPFFTCNYRCSYCYLNDNDLTSTKCLNPKILQEFLDNLGDTKIKAEILGGEPLLNPNLIKKIIGILVRYGVVSLKMSTNCSLIDRTTIDLLENFDEIRISLDATNEDTYKRIRGGHFNKIIGNIKQLLSKDLLISLSFVILKSNYSQIENFFHMASSLGVSKINIGYFIATGRGILIKDQVLSLREIEKISDKIKNLRQKYKIKVGSSLPEKIENKCYICPAGNKKFTILPNDSVVPCIFFRNINLGKRKIEKLILIKNTHTICPAFYP